MDRTLKTPWNFPGFEHERNPKADSFGGLSSSGNQGIKGEFPWDLKPGLVYDSSNEFGERSKISSSSKMTLSPSGLTKRARPISNAVQIASCLVDGCKADLSSCREYHRRHKVCEVHSKTPEVTINGKKQRFCQQCSRFHSLEEFDEGKRSCRKRLDGHNRRRRKPQPESLSCPRSLFSSAQGATMLQFSGPGACPTTAVTNSMWSGVVMAGDEAKFYGRESEKQFGLVRANNRSSPEPSPRRRLLQITPDASSAFRNVPEGDSGGKMYSCGDFSARPAHSDCALSLLSSPPPPPGTGTGHVACLDSVTPVGTTLYGSLENAESMTGPKGDRADVFPVVALHSSRTGGIPETLPFYWE